MKIFLNSLLLILLLCAVLVFNLLAHEFGHCLTMTAFGGTCDSVHAMPGIQVWPLSEFGRLDVENWSGSIAWTYLSGELPSIWHDGLVSLMGSGSTAIISVLALIILWVFRFPKWVTWGLFFQSWLFLDILTYTILPEWFGLRHFFFIGGTSAEPLYGAIRMGIARDTFIVFVLIFSALMIVGCLAALYHRLGVGRSWRLWRGIQSGDGGGL